MVDTRSNPDYLPWLLAYEQNWLPDPDGKFENDDIGGDEHMILLASYTITSNCLFIYDHEWDR